MKLTTNYSLKKPEGSDVVNIDDFNYNADIIDSAMKEVKSNISALKDYNGYGFRVVCDNANTLNVDNGIYITTTATVGVKNPGLLIHQNYDLNYAFQLLHKFDHALFMRAKADGVWGEWEYVVTEKEYSRLKTRVANLETSSSSLRQDIVNHDSHLTNLMSSTNELNNRLTSLTNVRDIHGYGARVHCPNANTLDVANGVYVTGDDTVGVNGIGILTHIQWDMNYGYQLLHRYDGRLYVRAKYSNAWEKWREIYTGSVYSLLEEQVTENENKISILECENKALKEELTQIQTSIASLIATTLEEK